MIELREVTHRYGPDQVALSQISLSFGEGQFTFVTGPSGAGKSTLLKLIYAAERVSEGDVLVGGSSIAHIHPDSVPWLRRNIGIVFQNFRLLPRRSVGANIALPLEVRGDSLSELRRRVLLVADRVGLSPRHLQRLPAELSAGEQQRAAIARAVVGEPAILLADEPTGNLDEDLGAGIFDLMISLAREGATVLVATHDRFEVDRRAQREVQLVGGAVAFDRGADDDPDVETLRAEAPL